MSEPAANLLATTAQEVAEIQEKLRSAETHLLARNRQKITAELTLGLLHRLNNIMTGIYFAADTCQSEVAPNHPARESVELLAESARDAQEVIDRTTDLNLSLPPENTYHDLNELLLRQTDLLKIILPKTCNFTEATHNSPLYVQIAECEFRDLLLSLAMNSRAAANPASRLKVSVQVLPANLLSDRNGAAKALPTGMPAAAVCFSDNGCGIPMEAFDHLFEAFSSTRPGAAGLGLFHAQQVAIKYGGTLEAVRQTPGAGAEFVLLLPLANLAD